MDQYTSKDIEILAPGGDLDSIKAAILAGANAIFCGLNKFNARNRANNISIDDLDGVLHLAHSYDCKIFLTLNIILVEEEIPHMIKLLNRLVNMSIDGIILQDFGLFYIVNTYFPSLKIHASTQLTTHNSLQILFLKRIHAERVNLSRELHIDEVKQLSEIAHQNCVDIEVFVHGSYCLSYSGQCYLSSVINGNSGNRGRCSQPCRDAYLKTRAGYNYPLNMKDNSTIDDVNRLIEAGADSLKIEGRIKKYHYVYAAVKTYQDKLDSIFNKEQKDVDTTMLHSVFHRSFTQGFLQNKIGEDMFIDYPRDYSSIYFAQQDGDTSPENLDRVDKILYDRKTDLRNSIESKMVALDSNKQAIHIVLEEDEHEHLVVHVNTSDHQLTYTTQLKLQAKGKIKLTKTLIEKRFNPLNTSEYFIQDIDVDKLKARLYMPLQELTVIRNKIHKELLYGRSLIEEVVVPKIARNQGVDRVARTSFLIDDLSTLDGLNSTSIDDVYFEIPNIIGEQKTELSELFMNQKQLIPWFQSIVPEDQLESVRWFLEQVQPQKIVSNNSGIIQLANQLQIDCIAGPHLNLSNSFALKTLKETYQCTGAFLSNELNKRQLHRINAPSEFELHFSIYHPITLMTSKACLFQTTSGCHRRYMESLCIGSCTKRTTIESESGEKLIIEKKRHNLHRLIYKQHYLNLDVVQDLEGKFDNFLIDLRSIQTETTQTEFMRSGIADLRNYILKPETTEKEILREMLGKTNNRQYNKGI